MDQPDLPGTERNRVGVLESAKHHENDEAHQRSGDANSWLLLVTSLGMNTNQRPQPVEINSVYMGHRHKIVSTEIPAGIDERHDIVVR